MNDIIVVTKAEHVADFILALTFNDGVKAEIDFAGWIERYPHFAPLKDIDYFKNFTLDGWTVAWPNGADIAPETLHKLAVESQEPQSA
jgi:hypothetical protein